jgi:hypothetical protein
MYDGMLYQKLISHCKNCFPPDHGGEFFVNSDGYGHGCTIIWVYREHQLKVFTITDEFLIHGDSTGFREAIQTFIDALPAIKYRLGSSVKLQHVLERATYLLKHPELASD